VSVNEGEKRQSLSIQTVDGRGKPFGGPGVEVELYIDGKRQQTIGKKTPKPVTLKFPAGHKTRVLAKVSGFASQEIEVGPSASQHNFRFKGAGQPIVLIVATKDCEAAAVRAVCNESVKKSGVGRSEVVWRDG
jgi:hypothetical protein